MVVKIAFCADSLDVRGTCAAMYDYANYSEILLKKYEKSNLIRVNPSYCSISEEFRKKTALLSCGIIEAIEILNKI